MTNMLFHETEIRNVEGFIANPSGSLILLGEKGLGKYHMARYIAAAILGCDEKDLSVSQDFFEVRTDKGSIGIDELQPLKQFCTFASEAKKKVCIIDDANLMSVAACNSLLKLLEDANSRAVVILVAHEALIDTIHSRCHVIRFSLFEAGEVREWLCARGEDVNLLALLFAHGRIGYYRFLCEQKQILDVVNGFLSAFCKKDKKGMLEALSLMQEKDGKNFYESYSKAEVKSFILFIGDVAMAVYYSLYKVESLYAKVMDIEEAMSHYSYSEIVHVFDLVHDHYLAVSSGGYTKNNFLDFIRSL